MILFKFSSLAKKTTSSNTVASFLRRLIERRLYFTTLNYARGLNPKEVLPRSKMTFWLYFQLFPYLFAIKTSQGLESNHRQVLTIGGFYASGKMTTFQNASGIIQTVNEAVRTINERSQLLPGYKLEIEWRDTKVCRKYVCIQNINSN